MHIPVHASRAGGAARQRWLRIGLLELWGMLVLAAVIGFLGPFGTYAGSPFVQRAVRWWQLLMGAYLLIRPAMALLGRFADHISLPRRQMVFWGVILCSLPLAVIWRAIGSDAFRYLPDYTGLLPFSTISALSVMGVVEWARSADLRLRTIVPSPAPKVVGDAEPPSTQDDKPSLLGRLDPAFFGPILALQSEDHYVRVHGMRDSELVLMRLRDAIREMDGVEGEQVHRSWWVAKGAACDFNESGRSWVISLPNGTSVPIARESVSRLQRSGFLPVERN